MKSLWQIILSILWCLRPVQALEVNLNDVITMGLALFADEAEIDDITHDPAYRSTLAAAFFDAHRKLDLLIYLRACEIAGVRPRITSFKPDYSHTSSSADLIKLWKSFHRLVAKFDAYERYAIKRAERLRAYENDYPLRLAATLQSTAPAPRAVKANRPLNVQIASTCAQHWGRWIARPCAQDGGGACAFARGPPSHQSIAYCRLPQRSAPEIAPARPNPWLTGIYPPRNVSRETSVGGQNRRVHWSEADMHRHSQTTGRCIKMHPTGSRPAYI